MQSLSSCEEHRSAAEVEGVPDARSSPAVTAGRLAGLGRAGGLSARPPGTTLLSLFWLGRRWSGRGGRTAPEAPFKGKRNRWGLLSGACPAVWRQAPGEVSGAVRRRPSGCLGVAVRRRPAPSGATPAARPAWRCGSGFCDPPRRSGLRFAWN